MKLYLILCIPLLAVALANADTCADTPTPEGFSCVSQKEWGKCGEIWMVEGNYCELTCGRCQLSQRAARAMPWRPWNRLRTGGGETQQTDAVSAEPTAPPLSEMEYIEEVLAPPSPEYLEVYSSNLFCSQPPITGPCRAAKPRWFYSSSRKGCYPFVYGGCEGNSNNFEQYDECFDAAVRHCSLKAPPQSHDEIERQLETVAKG